MDPRVSSLANILRLNTKLFRNCLDGFTDEAACRRPAENTNCAAYVAAHVNARFLLLRVIGVDRPSPLGRYLDGAKGQDDVKQLPPLAEVQEAWTSASHALRGALDGLTPEALDGPTLARFPFDQTMLGALTFLVQHDSYHVGQLSLLRKQAGLPAMKYS